MRTSALCLTMLLFVSAAHTQTVESRSYAEINDAAWTLYQAGLYAEAYREWLPIALKGNDVAQTGLGLMFGQGKGVPLDPKRAFEWYRKAATQGNTAAQVNLGNLYAEGRGVPQDFIKAYAWFNVAAAYGEPQGATNKRTLVEVFNMTPHQIAEAQSLSTETWTTIEQFLAEHRELGEKIRQWKLLE